MKLENGILALVATLLAGMGLDLSGISAWLAELADLSLWAFQWGYRLGLLGLAGGLVVGLARLHAGYSELQADKAHNKRLRELDIEERQADIAIKRAMAVSSGRAIQVLKPSQRAIIAGHTGELSLIEAAATPQLPPIQGECRGDGQACEPMSGLIETMLQHQRLLLIGGSGSGKTNTLKHFVARLVERGERLLILDPHSPSKLAGCDVVGAGLDFEAIGNKMIDVMLTVNQRYQSGNISQDGNTGNDTWLIVDEMRDINSALGELSEKFLECMLVRGRKAGFRFCLVSQNDTTSSLGLKGDKDLFRAAERVELKRDPATGQRRAFIGWRASDKVELQMPGLYEGDHVSIPANQLVIDQPPTYTDSERQLALTVATLNGQAGQISKAEIFRRANVGKNKPMNDFLTKLLEG